MIAKRSWADTPKLQGISMGDDLELSFAATKAWFPLEKKPSYVFIRVTDEQAALPAALGKALRRCYLTDERVNSQGAQFPHTVTIAAGLPDRGATMAGDFGDILSRTAPAAKTRKPRQGQTA